MSDRHPNYTIPWARVRVSAGDKPGTMRLTEFGLATYDGSRWTLADLEPRTWAQLRAIPTALLTPGMVCRVTDYAYQQWVWDGTYWRPAQGRVTIAQQWGDYATPLAMLSATVAGQFTTPGGNPLIPAGMIIPHSSVRVFTMMKKVGGTATVSFQCRIGTANNTSDSLFAATTPSPTATNLDIQLSAAARFRNSSSRLAALQYSGDGLSAGTVGPGNDFTANINTMADMRVTFSVLAGNVADSYNFIGYNVWLET